MPPEKISLKILQSSEPIIAHNVIKPSQPVPKRPEPILVPKPVQSQKVLSPKKPDVPEMKAIAAAPQITPEPSPSIVASKTIEMSPVVTQAKTLPTPIQVQETYKEDNLGRIRSILAERLKYPKNALRLNQQGEITVTFTLETDREVSQITITQSSGFELLDDAARKLIETSASEFPKPSKSVRITVPISYKLR
jgi:protein TonB